jgi:hypothetical protein
MKNRELKAAQIIEHFLNDELSNYSQLSEHIKIVEAESHSNDKVYVEATVRNKSLYFKVEFKEHFEEKVIIDDDNYYQNVEISIELGEDSYETIETFNYSIKYFWQELLDWDVLFDN